MSLSTFTARLNTVFAFFVTIMFSLLTMIAVSGPLLLYMPSSVPGAPRISVSKLQIGKGYYHSHEKISDYGMLWFDLDADLRPLFNWNTKQLFIFVALDVRNENAREIQNRYDQTLSDMCAKLLCVKCRDAFAVDQPDRDLGRHRAVFGRGANLASRRKGGVPLR
ncbi:signal peptidase subunit-domain-containing protein [Zopfochytrium polystomum]|nr:signal peptidase subunit-domain-containing protein [Zopfochytrium polystomum]